MWGNGGGYVCPFRVYKPTHLPTVDRLKQPIHDTLHHTQEDATTAARRGSDRCAADPGRQLRILDGQGNTPLLLAARLDDADTVMAMAAAEWELDMRNVRGFVGRICVGVCGWWWIDGRGVGRRPVVPRLPLVL